MATVLLATDADWIDDAVTAAVADHQTEVRRVSSGADVLPAVVAHDPDLVILDMQIGNMGGMATCLALRNEEGAGRVDLGPILMLLDRDADIFLARRSQAQGWLVKPLDAFRIRRAVESLLAGGEHHEPSAVEAAAVSGFGSQGGSGPIAPDSEAEAS